MQLPTELQNNIVDFLKSLPNMSDKAGWEGLINRANLDDRCKTQCCHFSQSTTTLFFQLLVSELIKYGKLDDGRNSLEAVLQAAKDFIGKDRREFCNNLIQKLREHLDKPTDDDRTEHSEKPSEDVQLQPEQTFVPRYEYDICLSFVDVDDQPRPGAKEGWVTTLLRNLRHYLDQKLGRDAYFLWSPHQLPGHVPKHEAIKEVIDKSATFIVILSRTYLTSEWCQKDKIDFLGMVMERGWSTGSRVFIVERDQLDRPQEFDGLEGYRFWVKDREGKPARTITPTRDEVLYFDTLEDLCNDLVDALQK